MSAISLACIAAAIIMCYLFLYLVGKEKEIHAKDRKIRLWRQRMEAKEREAMHVANAPPTIAARGVEDESLPTVMEAGDSAEPVATAEPMAAAESVSQP